MDTVATMAAEPTDVVESVQEMALGMVRASVNAAHDFLDWQRAVMYGQPDASTRARHRQTLKLLLRLMRFLHAQAADPDYPDRSAAQELEAAIWKLNQSWEQFYNPMPEPEAQELLRHCFPGHGS